ncbi:MAG TPA: hypothetical protein VLV83_16020 [Acidobacteriota bacterium]|nr:hypothetical protein [Acidobacteriota bacterium]
MKDLEKQLKKRLRVEVPERLSERMLIHLQRRQEALGLARRARQRIVGRALLAAAVIISPPVLFLFPLWLFADKIQLDLMVGEQLLSQALLYAALSIALLSFLMAWCCSVRIPVRQTRRDRA